MPRGPKQHLKRLSAPKSWALSKMGGVFAARPRPGPHRLRECFPLVYLIKNRLKLADTAKEAKIIMKSGAIVVNGKPRTDHRFPLGLMDVIYIKPKNQTFRLLYNANGRFCLAPMRYNAEAEKKKAERLTQRKERMGLKEEVKTKRTEHVEKKQPTKISLSENKFSALTTGSKTEDKPLEQMVKILKAQQSKKSEKKGKIEDPNQPKFTESRRESVLPCKVRKILFGHKKAVGVNPAASGSNKQIPWLTTNCGRTFRYVDKGIKSGDTIVVKIVSYRQQFPGGIVQYTTKDEIVNSIALEEGKIAIITSGHNIGRVGRVMEIEKHSLTTDVVHLVDENSRKFVTECDSVFMIGNEEPIIGLAADRGLRKTLLEKVQEQLKK